MYKVLFPALIMFALTGCHSSRKVDGHIELTTACQAQCNELGKKVDETYSTETGKCQCQTVV